jgi:hypothetical protein
MRRIIQTPAQLPAIPIAAHRLAAVVAAAAWLAAACPSALRAQANTTTTGLFGQQQMGSSRGASPSSTGSGMTTGMGGNSAGGATTGTSFGSGLVSGMQNLRAGGNNGFVGVTAATAQNPLSMLGAGAQVARGPNLNSLQQLMTQSRQNQFNQQQAQRQTRGAGANQAQAQFRVPMRLGFQPQPPAAPRFNSAVSARLSKVPALSKLGPINVSLEGTIAVLRGTVATEADRELAAGLARLEPEVSAVDNRLVVGAVEGSGREALPSAAGTRSP